MLLDLGTVGVKENLIVRRIFSKTKQLRLAAGVKSAAAETGDA